VERAETYLRLLAEREIRGRTDLHRLRRAAATLADAGAVDEATIATIMDGAEMGSVVRSGSVQFPRQIPRIRPVPAADDGEWRVVPVGQAITARTGVLVVSAVVRTGRGVFLAAMGPGGEQVPLEDLVALTAVDDRGNLYGFSRDCPAALELSPPPPEDIQWLTIKDDDTERRTVDLTTPAAPLAAKPADGSLAERLLIRRAEATLAAAARTGVAARTAGFTPGGASFGETAEVLRETGLLAADSQVPAQLAALCQQLGLSSAGLPTATELPEPWHDVLARISRRHRHAAPEVDPITPLAIYLPDVNDVRILLTGLNGSRLYMIAQDRAPARYSAWSRVAWTHGPRPALSTIAAPSALMSIWAQDADGHHHVAVTSEFRVRSNGLASGELELCPPLPSGPVTLTITGRDTTATVAIP
jgi:hypothetical protein